MANIGGFLQQLAQNYLANERQKYTGVSDEQAALNKLGVQQAQTAAEFQRPKAEAELRLLQVRPEVLQSEADRKARADQELALYRQALAKAVAGKEERATAAAPGQEALTGARTEALTERTAHPERFRAPAKPKWQIGESLQGEPILYNPDTDETKPFPSGAAPKLSATTANRVDAAKSALEVSGGLQDYIGQHKDVLGPMIGRYNTLAAAAGAGDPVATELIGALMSYSSLQPQIHGFRSAEFVEKIRQLINIKQTPESLLGAIRGIDAAAKAVSNRGRAGAGVGPHAVPVPPAGLSPEVEKRLKALGL